ncbi:unnamed protein product [Prorocentrum cordatum]|uniref:Uncharacterized protein n=1 Tax=Prorocentrum cordatum TaxID=2364126 RepID=A0ABN9SKY8_9DINO|nr:unnamed protein product [Polarella glacialis]|mmetsp:Transcript_9943/g.26278  ORF Transcript_9943/g.26278 Transcript_9943/m.26278 type:complete len:140 (-) Transcript_9943:43-462(-)
MEMLYRVGGIPVIVLPSLYGAQHRSSGSSSLSTRSVARELSMSNKYLSRGWCFFELCLAFAYGNIANAQIDPNVQDLVHTVKRLNADSVEGFREAFKRTRFTCEGDEAVVLQLFERTLRQKRARLSAAALLRWPLHGRG